MLDISDKKYLESTGIVLCSENKGTNDQLCGYHTADLGLCFDICKKQVSHNPAQLVSYGPCCEKPGLRGFRPRSVTFRAVQP